MGREEDLERLVEAELLLNQTKARLERQREIVGYLRRRGSDIDRSDSPARKHEGDARSAQVPRALSAAMDAARRQMRGGLMEGPQATRPSGTSWRLPFYSMAA
jgi:hypothetical protein